MKKIFLISSIVLVTISILVVIFFHFTFAKNTSISSNNGKIQLDGVLVKNFQKNTTIINAQDDMYLVNDENKYAILYQPQSNNQFLISILNSPFEIYRQQAEKNFLQILGISKTDACKLHVQITTPRFANPNEAGIVYPLSFCK